MTMAVVTTRNTVVVTTLDMVVETILVTVAATTWCKAPLEWTLALGGRTPKGVGYEINRTP